VSDLIDTRYHYDAVEDKLTVQRIQDVEPIIEANKRAANDASSNWRGDMHHVASIPLVVLEHYRNRLGIDLLKDGAALKRFLNDPENAFMRTKRGRI